MKVALYGNICNNFYTLAKALRQRLQIDAHLYLNPDVDLQHRPESDDPLLKNNYPDWIHVSSKWSVLPFLKSHDRTFIKELNKYDVVFLSDLGVTLTPFLQSKTFFYVTGGDLTVFPFPKKYRSGMGFRERLKREYIGWMQRRGIRHATRILTQPFYPFANALKELSIDPAKISNCYFPILIDTNVVKFNEDAWQQIDAKNKSQLEKYKFIIFHPSRLMLQSTKAYVDSGQWKGNDNLFKALEILIKKYHIQDACIAMPDRKYSADREKARQIIAELGIEQNIVWLATPTLEGFPRKELMNYYSISDIVADEFATGWFGSVVLEGMACSKPTFCYVDEPIMKHLYPWHPIISEKDPERIADKLVAFYFDKDKAVEKGKISREWAIRFHSITNGSEIYVENFRKDLKDFFDLPQPVSIGHPSAD